MILLRNFYVICSGYSHNDNFLDAPALEACNLIKNLVGILPTNVVKTENTLEDVIERLVHCQLQDDQVKYLCVTKENTHGKSLSI
jgi:hypothetical protein